MTAERTEAKKSADGTAAEKLATPISRREFARRAAIASAVASVAPAGVVSGKLASRAAGSSARTEQTTPPPPVAQDASSPNQNPPAALPPLPANAPRLSVESQAEADARFQIILAQYGSRFSDEQRADLRRLCTVAQPSLERLRAYTVGNGDGPGLYLKPLFEREKKPKPPGAGKGPAPAGAPASSAATKP